MENNTLTSEPTYWQHIRLKLLRWWLFTFCNKTIWEGEIGGFRYRFRKYWLDINSIALNHWNLRISAANHAYGFLLAAIGELPYADEERRKHLLNHLSYFSTNIYNTSAFIFADEKFAKGLKKELEWAYNRLIRKAKEQEAKVTKEENDADEALMQSVVNEAGMTRQQRRKAQREQRKEMRVEAKKIANDLSKDDE